MEKIEMTDHQNTSFKERLRGEKPLLGTLLSIPSPEIAEIISSLDFDWLFVDAEHGALDVLDVQRIIQAAGEASTCLVRVPLNDEIWIKKALDAGAHGIIVPQVNSAREAQLAVRFSKYPPMGSRSVGLARAHGYGGIFKKYVEEANRNTLVIVQVELIEAVKNIDAIVKVKGVDGVFVGLFDLSASMGKPGLMNNPELKGAIARIKKAADRVKMPLGIFVADADSAKSFMQEGFMLVCVATDTMFLRRSAEEMLNRLKR
jgi:2-keto-3-deoxy-L-rhamnonate aldolase RhmA